MKKRLIILGAGGHGRVCADIADRMGCYEEISFLDDRGDIDGVVEFPVIGKCSDFIKWMDDADFFVGMGNTEARQHYVNLIREHDGTVTSLVHPEAVIGANVAVGYGAAIMAGAVINPGSRIGNGAIVNTCSSVDHDNHIGDYCHISVGAHLAGNVNVGNYTMLGAGATVINNVSICDECMIGAGAVVVKNIKKKGTYIGVPAKPLE